MSRTCKAAKGVPDAVAEAYCDYGPSIEKTRTFCNGLMLAVRPAVLAMVEANDQGHVNRNGHTVWASPTVDFSLSKSYDNVLPGVRLYNQTLCDTHDRPHAPDYGQASLLGTTISLWTERTLSDGSRQDDVSRLTWGAAESSMVPGYPYTRAGVGEQYPRAESLHGLAPRYRDLSDFRQEYVEAYVTRTASALLVARIVDVAAEAEGTQRVGNAFDGVATYDRAAEIVAHWSEIDPATTARVWQPVVELYDAA